MSDLSSPVWSEATEDDAPPKVCGIVSPPTPQKILGSWLEKTNNSLCQSYYRKDAKVNFYWNKLFNN